MPKGRLHLRDKNVQLMLEITTVASGNRQSRVAVCRFGVGCCFLAPSPLVLVVKKCGMGTNESRWGWQRGIVHKITAGLELLPKFRLFLRKAFYTSSSAQIEIPLTMLLEFLPKFKRKLNVNLEAGVTVWQ